MNIPNHLTSLAADINAALTRDEKNRDDWIAIKLDLCRLFADARAKFTDDNSFGSWLLKEVGNTVSKDDRAAYIAMGADLEAARAVLEKTTSRSIRLVYLNEFRFRNAAKPAKPHKPRSPTENDERDEQIGALYNKGLGRKEIKELMPDVTGGILDNVIKKHRVAEEAREQGQLEGAPLSATAQEKLDAHKRKLEKDFDWIVRQEVIKEVNKLSASLVQTWKENLATLEKALNRRGKVFSKVEYNILLRVIHPDTGSNASDEQRNAAFRLLNDRKVRLLDEEAFPTVAARAPMHRTLAEMEAARAEVRAENSARAKKGAATRKARQQQQQETH